MKWFMGPLAIVSVLALALLMGCTGETKTANILWDNVDVTVTEYANVPTDVAVYQSTYTTYSQLAGAEQKTETVTKPYRVVKLTLSGDPHDHFYAYDVIGALSIYDEDGSMCSSIHPISGQNDDVLVKGKVELIGLITCKNQNAEKSQFIFRESTTQGLNEVGDKFFVDLADKPSDETLQAIREWSSKH